MDPVLYWNSILLEVSRRDFTRGYNNAQQPGPIRTSRAMAIVHIAIHDAVAFKNKPTAAYLNKKGFAHGITAVPGNVEDVIAGAATETLKALYPKFTSFIDDSLEKVQTAPFNAGKKIGQAVLKERIGDQSDLPLNGPQPMAPAPGEHRADPFAPNQPQLGPVWGSVRRFTGPGHQGMNPFPALGTAQYLTDFIEARDYGAVERRKRSAEQQRIGVYWGYDGANNLGVPPRLYNQVARAVIRNKPAMSLGKQAELFAMINVAMADAGIDAWHYKYVHNLWRPVIGIRYENSGESDPFWAPLGAPQTNSPRNTLTPNFPAYPSGHATFGAALMQCLRRALVDPTNPITIQDVRNVGIAIDAGNPIPINPDEKFTFISDELDGVASDPDGSVRTQVKKEFRNFAEAIWENSVSRIYLGVHWRFDGYSETDDNVGGTPLGLDVGDEAFEFFNDSPSL